MSVYDFVYLQICHFTVLLSWRTENFAYGGTGGRQIYLQKMEETFPFMTGNFGKKTISMFLKKIANTFTLFWFRINAFFQQ